MDNLEISKAVKDEVGKLLAAKDASAQIEKTIAGLNKSLATVTGELATAKADAVTAQSELEESQKAVETAKAETVTVTEQAATTAAEVLTEKEKSDAKITELEGKLGKIEKDQVIASRKVVLEEAGLLLDGEEIQNKQIAKIADMSDEVFTDYVEESKAFAGKKVVVEATEAEKAEAAEALKAKADLAPEIGKTGDVAKSIAAAQGGIEISTDNVSKFAQI